MQRESLTRQGSKAGEDKGEDGERKRPPPLRAKEKGVILWLKSLDVDS